MPTSLSTRVLYARAALLAIALALAACETPVRVPGLSLAFPDTNPQYVATRRLTETLAVLPATDTRTANLNRDVANSGWMACKADTLADGELPKLVDARLLEAIQKSQIYSSVSTERGAPWTLEAEIQVFCSQTRGFIGRRVAGLVSIRFTLRRGDTMAWQGVVEHVVTDADPEYTGSFVTTVEQAMRRSMADSFRLVLRDALGRIEESAKKS